MSVWNPELYERFERERSRPFHDLAALLRPVASPRVLDLGCGTGALTAGLHERLGARETIGVDSSETMLEKASAHATESLRFERRDLREVADLGTFDVVISNAALHWVEDHEALLARLASSLAEGGQLAVQVPANHHHASHTVAAELAAEEPYASWLGGYVRVAPVLEPRAYAELLHRLGFREQEVLQRVYAHLLPNWREVVRWVEGTTLTDYQRRMEPAEYAAFLAEYETRMGRALPHDEPLLFPFQRTFFWGRT